MDQLLRPILWFEDKLGITDGYLSIWSSLLQKANLSAVPVHRRSSYQAFGSRLRLLEQKGNRKLPGFNTDPRAQSTIRRWVCNQIRDVNPILCISTDPALGFLANPDWDQATVDNLRGGVYEVESRPWVCTLPISAWHRKKSAKDIAKLNDGFKDRESWEAARAESEDAEDGEDDIKAKEEWESEDNSSFWLEPVMVPEGKFVLTADVCKAGRIYHRIINTP